MYYLTPWPFPWCTLTTFDRTQTNSSILVWSCQTYTCSRGETLVTRLITCNYFNVLTRYMNMYIHVLLMMNLMIYMHE